ncbi:MAG: hypothetical protein KAR44_07655 [Candidatus Aegiribacteria sp.]|nr:hypothetical protein [Candidatus Aegiribacteria sp.]
MKVQSEDQRVLEAEEGYTAVIYFHGIGNQRRFEETGRLIDSLETCCILNRENNPVTGTDHTEFMVNGICEETSRVGEEESVSFVDTQLHRQDGQSDRKDSYRFYEVYWAPLASEEVPTGKVLLWLGKCAFQTVKAWIVCLWRTRPVIHKMALSTLISTEKEKEKEEEKEEEKEDHNEEDGGIYEQEAYLLEEAYSEFSKSEARMKYPRGSFRKFKAFLYNYNVQHINNLIEAAEKWKKTFDRMQLWNIFKLLTLFLFLFLLAAAVIWSVILRFPGLSSSIIEAVEGSLGIKFSLDLRTYDLINGILIGAGIFLLFYMRYFLRKYVGDIQFWGTYEETNTRYKTREQILNCGIDMLRHVVENEKCKRVVIIAHSLGTSIAFSSMQEYSRMLKLRGADKASYSKILSKFDHFVTLGSPIDKIAYFFGGDMGKYARVDELLEDIRGKITDPPFASSAGQEIHWVNYYDVGDIISGSIESVLNFRIPDITVDNVCVACTQGFPNPGACHTGYFSYRKVMKDIFEMVFDKRYSYRLKKIEKIPKPDYSTKARKQAKIDFRLLMLMPWLLLVMIFADLINFLPVVRIYFRLIIGLLTISLGLWLGGRYVLGMIRGHRNPLKRRCRIFKQGQLR